MSESFIINRATDARLLKRSCESLIGIASGLIADGELNDKEIIFLSTWLSDHVELSNTWPGEVICARIRTVLSDGVITSEERTHLQDTLAALVGGNFAEDGAVSNGSTYLPIDTEAKVTIRGKSFCFTGEFVYGTRTRCEQAVQVLGGTLKGVSKKLDFLVVGELASRDWKYSAHGNKIEAAIEAKKAGGQVRIIGESQWAEALQKAVS